MKGEVAVFWFRRDLRLEDNTGLFRALSSGSPVLPIFIFDTEIIKELPPDDARVSFIHRQLQQINGLLRDRYGSSLAFYHGKPVEVFQDLLRQWTIKAVFTNRDYEPYAVKRDQDVKTLLETNGIPLHTFKDQVVFEKSEVVKGDGEPYVVYTPYMKKWKEVLGEVGRPETAASESHLEYLVSEKDLPYLSLEDIGFEESAISVPEYNLGKTLIRNYEKTRNLPARDGTSHLGPHLRFGTVSIRKVLEQARNSENETFWNELIWREFFMQILWHFPHTVEQAFKKKYDRIRWRNREEEFELWKEGRTGYALVDAGMRQLNQTGYMHNRVRMLVASFLCKHLLIDWRWGEAYFAEKLLDYELASNVGNWQWAAGSGVDAAPYFRIFNPMTQVDKFDRDREYIRKWVPEFGSEDYPEKMVDHKKARERCLKVYKEALT
jgi:deoxyribodipyrimidine photo-lyase